MLVSDSSHGAPPPARAGKDEVRARGEAVDTAARAGTGPRFRRALERKRDDPATGAHDGASAAAMAGWFRSESPAPPPGKTTAVTGQSGAPAARAVDRILVGSGPDGAEARIRIGAGALAGTEIQLSSGVGGHVVEARLLTHAASSRQTLSLVMDEIRLRLRDRGIVLSTTPSGARPVARPADAEGTGEGARPATQERGRSSR
jgi:hypothetical protein